MLPYIGKDVDDKLLQASENKTMKQPPPLSSRVNLSARSNGGRKGTPAEWLCVQGTGSCSSSSYTRTRPRQKYHASQQSTEMRLAEYARESQAISYYGHLGICFHKEENYTSGLRPGGKKRVFVLGT